MSTSIQTQPSVQSSEKILCFNKGCGKTYDVYNNTEDSCQFHPGVPVFHDALKGWSCCNKKSTDFTQFLSIPGCTKAAHSNVKPVEPEKPKEDVAIKGVQVVQPPKVPELTPRPTQEEIMIEMRRTIAPTLASALEKLTESMQTPNLGFFLFLFFLYRNLLNI